MSLTKFSVRAISIVLVSLLLAYSGYSQISLREKCSESLLILADDLIKLQNLDPSSDNYGALYCHACSDYHTRASESVLPFAVAYRVNSNKKYLNSAIQTGEWLIQQQLPDGSWIETPSDWTGTTTDQLLVLSVAYPILRENLTDEQSDRWRTSIQRAADWLVKHMDHEFASINYCATTTASMMTTFQVIPDSAYVKKAKELAMLVLSKFDDDYFLTGEGNRIRGTKYGIDLGYNMDMSLWGLGLYAALSGDAVVNGYVREALKRHVYFVYPDGSTDGSWGVRSSKWTTYGSFTADGSQILFSLYSATEPAYRTAALANLDYLMNMRVNGLLTYGPHYYDLFDAPPCIYPTFCRTKNLALAIVFGDQGSGPVPNIPSQNVSWSKYFATLDVALARTKNFMATITGYRYKDIRRGAEFKYMFRPSGGSITNLWANGYGHLQASSQTEYHRWEMNYPEAQGALPLTPRLEFADTNAYYTNLYEFDSHMEVVDSNGLFVVTASGELKDRNRWEGGVAYSLTHIIADNFVEKRIRLRFHGQRPEVRIIEPIIQHNKTLITSISNHKVKISAEKKEFVFELFNEELKLELATHESDYRQPFPSLKGYPILIRVKPDEGSFLKEVRYRLTINDTE